MPSSSASTGSATKPQSSEALAHAPMDASSASANSTPFAANDPHGILARALALTDLVFGLYALELWTYDGATGLLRPVGLGADEEAAAGRCGPLRLRRRPREAAPGGDGAAAAARAACARLTDPGRGDFLPAIATDPGVGLPGVLWADAQPAADLGAGFSRMKSSLSGGGRGGGVTSRDDVVWRDVGELAEDPDQPCDERLQSFAKAGFTLAAGIPFDINGYRGIVVYFGNPHAESDKLRHPANSKFMKSVAQLIGCASAIQVPMKEVTAFREEVRCRNWHRLKIKLLTTLRFGKSLRLSVEENGVMASGPEAKKKSSATLLCDVISRLRNDAKGTLTAAKDGVQREATRWLRKAHGGSAAIPPRFSNSQMLWTFLGVAITHTILSRLNLLIQTESGGDLSLVLAPLGALTTLQYNLTAAPASQPRNAFFAQVFCVTVALAVSALPGVPEWCRSVLAPALVIPGMARLGIIHPPAGAAAIVFSSGQFGWEHGGIFLSGVALSIVIAVCINNLSDKRQYPTSWYLLNKAKHALSKK